MTTNAPLFSAWMDQFFEAYYRNRPVNATFIGVHDYDHRLPDFSENGTGDTLAEMESLLDRLQALPQEPLTPIERIDRLLAEGFLKIQSWEYRSDHFHNGNPGVYTGEAIFGLMSLFLGAGTPLAGRIEAAIARMQAIPAFLEQGRKNLRQTPAAWNERAIRECQGALAFLNDGLGYLVSDQHIDDPRFIRAAAPAREAFVEFQSYLETELRSHLTQNYACGSPAFDLMLRQGHFLEMTTDEIVAYAEQELQTAQAYLWEHASDFSAATPEAALAHLADLHPTTEGYLGRYAEFWQAARQASLTRDLVTWPDFPIRYIPQPRWARKAAPYLYFLFYRAPAAFNRPPVHDYLVTPVEASLPPEQQESLLRSNNDSVIKLNHVLHHGSLGHHIQNWNAYHSKSRLGQVAAVDCASRIAMFCGGTMAEGWAVYASDLIADTDFMTPLERYSEYQSRRRFCARAIVDVQLHQEQFGLEEAARFYEQRAGMDPAFARSEAIKNSMNPGVAVIYLLGCDRIHNLRRNLATRQGDRFSLRTFHDQFLSYGSIPVELIAKEMEKEDDHAQ
jgi:hypothetical protein